MGRPTKLPPFLEEVYWSNVGRSASRRTMRNDYFFNEALILFVKDGNVWGVYLPRGNCVDKYRCLTYSMLK